MVFVFLLVGFVVVILMCVFWNDLVWYNLDEEIIFVGFGDDFDQGDNGWKIIYIDVFCFFLYCGLFCVVFGVGVQFLVFGIGIIVMVLLGMFNVYCYGVINLVVILLYVLICCIFGYVFSYFYWQIGGECWVWNIIFIISFFFVFFFLMWSVVNLVYWVNGLIQVLLVIIILLFLMVWLLVGFFFIVIGGIFGKNNVSFFDVFCCIKNIVWEILFQFWYKFIVIYMMVGGFLFFSVIFVELYYIFVIVWGWEQYILYGIFFFVFVILLSVGVCIFIVFIYFQLFGEDYCWWW